MYGGCFNCGGNHFAADCPGGRLKQLEEAAGVQFLSAVSPIKETTEQQSRQKMARHEGQVNTKNMRTWEYDEEGTGKQEWNWQVKVSRDDGQMTQRRRKMMVKAWAQWRQQRGQCQDNQEDKNNNGQEEGATDDDDVVNRPLMVLQTIEPEGLHVVTEGEPQRPLCQKTNHNACKQWKE